MVGRTVSLFPKVESPIGDVLLQVDRLSRGDAFRDVSFAVRAGEIFGLAGLVGAGRTEVARVLSGSTVRDAGEIRLTASSSRSAARRRQSPPGIAYLPEDRHQHGLVLDFPIAANITLPILPRLFPRLLVRGGDRAESRTSYIDHFASVRPESTSSSAPCPAGTSRRSCWPSGWRRSRAC